MLLGSAGLQPLVDLVCGQVEEVQVVLHGVAVPQPVSQADDPYKNREAGVTGDNAATAGLVVSQGGTQRDPEGPKALPSRPQEGQQVDGLPSFNPLASGLTRTTVKLNSGN